MRPMPIMRTDTFLTAEFKHNQPNDGKRDDNKCGVKALPPV